MLFIIAGCLGAAVLVIAALCMWVGSRNDPARTYHLGGYRGVRAADVTFHRWITHYAPVAAAVSVLLVIFGILTRKSPPH